MSQEESRLERHARKLAELDSAWSEFDKEQAAVEAETRRPGEKIDLMDFEELSRMNYAKHLYRDYYRKYYDDAARFSGFLRGMIAEFFQENDLQPEGDGMKDDVDRVSAGISNALMMYYLIATDMHFFGQFDPNLKDIMAGRVGPPVDIKDPNGVHLDYGGGKGQLLLSIMLFFKLQSEAAVGVSLDQASKTNKALSEKKLARHYILDTIQQQLKEDVYTASQKTILSGIIDDEVAKSAFEVLVTSAMGVDMFWGRTVGEIVKQVFALTPDNAGPIPDVKAIYQDACERRIKWLEGMAEDGEFPDDARGYFHSCSSELEALEFSFLE